MLPSFRRHFHPGSGSRPPTERSATQNPSTAAEQQFLTLNPRTNAGEAAPSASGALVSAANDLLTPPPAPDADPEKASLLDTSVLLSDAPPLPPPPAPLLRSMTDMVHEEIEHQIEDDLQFITDHRKHRQSVVMRATRDLADMSTTHKGRHEMLAMGAVTAVVRELIDVDVKTRHAAEDVLANLAEDAEDHPARAIAEEIVELLHELQEETPPETATPTELTAHAALIDATANLTALSRDMCLNFLSHGVVPPLVRYLGGVSSSARQLACLALSHLCKHSSVAVRQLNIEIYKGKPVTRNLLTIILSTQAACAVCFRDAQKMTELRVERTQAIRLLFYVHSLPLDVLPESNDEKARSSMLVARSMLHRKANREGTKRAAEKERQTRIRLTERNTSEQRLSAQRASEQRLSRARVTMISAPVPATATPATAPAPLNAAAAAPAVFAC